MLIFTSYLLLVYFIKKKTSITPDLALENLIQNVAVTFSDTGSSSVYDFFNSVERQL
jgi:hypothetical protein